MAVLEQLAEAICAVAVAHPTRVAITGRDAAGKTTLADALVPLVQGHGRPTLRAELDDFHRPGHKYRSMRGEFTPRSYYEEAYDYEAFRRLVLDPLGADGDRRARLALFSSSDDTFLPESRTDAPEDAVLLADGVFLLHPSLAAAWDFIVWLEVDEQTALARARARDIAWVGDADVVEARHRLRNFPAHALYIEQTRAPERADAVIDNRDPARPLLLRAPGIPRDPTRPSLANRAPGAEPPRARRRRR
jgi:uridine kinase